MVIIIIGDPQVQLTSDPASLVGSLCSTDVVVLSCRAEDVYNLRWYLNKTDYCPYIHSPGDTFPHSPNCQLPTGVRVVITGYSPNGDLMDVNSTLSSVASALMESRVHRIQCGSYMYKSNVVDVNITQSECMYTVNFTPLQMHIGKCMVCA